MKAKISLFVFAAIILTLASTQANADGECLYHYRVKNIGDGRDIKVFSVKGRRLSKTWVASMGGKSKKLGSDLIVSDKGFLDTETKGDNISPLKINKGCCTPIAFNLKWRCEASGNVRESSTFDKRIKTDFYSTPISAKKKPTDILRSAAPTSRVIIYRGI